MTPTKPPVVKQPTQSKSKAENPVSVLQFFGIKGGLVSFDMVQVLEAPKNPGGKMKIKIGRDIVNPTYSQQNAMTRLGLEK